MEAVEKIIIEENGIVRKINPKAIKRALVGFFGRGERRVPKMEAECLLVRKGIVSGSLEAKQLLDYLVGERLVYVVNSLFCINKSGDSYRIFSGVEEEW